MARKKEAEQDMVTTVEEEIDGAPERAETEAAGPEEPTLECEAGTEASYTLTAEEFEAARKHIETLTKERDDTVALLQRNQADFENYRRRNASIRADSYDEGRRDTIRELLTVLDNFDRAIENEDAEDAAWREGVKLAIRQLHERLEKLGLSEIETDGGFDPNMHEAVMQEAVEGKESGEILAVLQKGYRVGDRIIRHSMVKVAE
ncbi:MAG: nucleotide exchange factor GrpE [Clostridia bacterium]|nr:nucleotide exchange factor GrpE [Clostridia bacterium]